MLRYAHIRRLDQALSLSPTEFEYFVAYLFEKQGYQAQRVGGPNDGEIDVRLLKDGRRGIVQCKRYNTTTVTSPDVQKFGGAILVSGVDEAYFITTGEFTTPARNWASQIPNLRLINGRTLKRWIDVYNPPPPPVMVEPVSPVRGPTFVPPLPPLPPPTFGERILKVVRVFATPLLVLCGIVLLFGVVLANSSSYPVDRGTSEIPDVVVRDEPNSDESEPNEDQVTTTRPRPSPTRPRSSPTRVVEAYLTHYEEGNSYFDRNDYERAIAEYSEAIALRPDFDYAFYNRGIAYLHRQEYGRAVLDFNKVIELSADAELRRDGEERLEEIGEGVLLATVIYEGLNLRSEPNPESEINVVAVLVKDAQVQIVGTNQDNSWIQVRSDAGTGWISASPSYTKLEWVKSTPAPVASLPTPTKIAPVPLPTLPSQTVLTTSTDAIKLANGISPLGDANTAMARVLYFHTAQQHFQTLLEGVSLSAYAPVWVVTLWEPPSVIPPGVLAYPDTSSEVASRFFVFEAETGNLIVDTYISRNVLDIMGSLQDDLIN